jgi:hypothetical protein
VSIAQGQSRTAQIIQDISKFFDREFVDANVPPLLVHYTSMAAFEAIVRTRSIHFSQILTMNDYSEIQGPVAALHTILFGDTPPNLISRYPDADLELFDTLNQAYHADNGELYALCFSRYDLANEQCPLSMWRAYGGNGNGVGLVFRTEGLIQKDFQPISAYRMRYMDPSKLTQTLRYVLDWIDQTIPSGLPAAEARETFQTTARYLAWAIAGWKHDGFLEEAEWRFFYRASNDDGNLAQKFGSYRMQDGRALPVLSIPLDGQTVIINRAYSLQDLLERIVVGPAPDQALTMKALMRILRDGNIALDPAKILPCRIPYRARRF